jgi:hypothetical protein
LTPVSERILPSLSLSLPFTSAMSQDDDNGKINSDDESVAPTQTEPTKDIKEQDSKDPTVTTKVNRKKPTEKVRRLRKRSTHVIYKKPVIRDKHKITEKDLKENGLDKDDKTVIKSVKALFSIVKKGEMSEFTAAVNCIQCAREGFIRSTVDSENKKSSKS